MPPLYDNSVPLGSFNRIDDATALHICSGTPADRASVLSTSLANVAVTSGDFTVGAGSPSGRALTVAAKTGVAVTASGTPAHYCLIDGSTLIARAEINSASPNLTSGSVVDIPATTWTHLAPSSV